MDKNNTKGGGGRENTKLKFLYQIHPDSGLV